MASLRCLRAPWLNQAVLPRPRLRHAFDRQAIYSKEAATEEISTEQLNAVWEEHLKHEFSTKDTEETIKTMVRSPHTHRISSQAIHISLLSGCTSDLAIRVQALCFCRCHVHP